MATPIAIPATRAPAPDGLEAICGGWEPTRSAPLTRRRRSASTSNVSSGLSSVIATTLQDRGCVSHPP